MAPHKKLPIYTERTIAETRAGQTESAREFADATGQVSCKAGCSNCCHHAVHATIPEGVLAYNALARRGLWTPSMRKKIETHADRTWDLAPEVWHLSNIPCPLLEKNRCTIYQARPFVCRVTASKGDPYDCHPHRIAAHGGLVPKRAAVDGFFETQGQLLRRHGLINIPLAFSKAILLGEKIATGVLDIEQSLTFLVREMAAQ